MSKKFKLNPPFRSLNAELTDCVPLVSASKFLTVSACLYPLPLQVPPFPANLPSPVLLYFARSFRLCTTRSAPSASLLLLTLGHSHSPAYMYYCINGFTRAYDAQA